MRKRILQLLSVFVLILCANANAQNVGIGIVVPTQKLHVNGNLRVDGAFMPNNLPGTSGEFLMSQGAGIAPVWCNFGAISDTTNGAGDVNGDGFGDVIIGVTGYTNGQSLEGRCAVYMGDLQRARQARTRQYRSDLITPVQTSNGTFQADCAWGIGQDVWSAMGRARVRLVWEYKGHGPPFQGAPFTTWTGSTGQDLGWSDTGLLGSEFKRVLSTSTGSTSHPAWLVRVEHHPATSLDGRVFGRWFYHGVLRTRYRA